MMQRANISKSILSITSPGTHIVPGDTTLGRSLTRKCNEYAADIKKRRPHQFGFWASLPLPDIEGSIAEIEYAFDTLNADGIVLQTNFHGVYLGDPKLNPVFEALKPPMCQDIRPPCRAVLVYRRYATTDSAVDAISRSNV